MIKLFVADLDGCISFPFQTPDWKALTAIRTYSERSKQEAAIPPLTLCTGRPLPYVEAVAQWLDVKMPYIFESGGGIYNPVTNKISWSPEFEANRRHIEAIRKWVKNNVLDRYDGLMPEFTKKTDVGLIHTDSDVIHQLFPVIKNFIEKHYHQFEVHYTEVSINVILKKSNKGTGVNQLCRLLKISEDEIAYIGDGTNDIPALEKVGYPFAPSNCRQEVAKVAEVIDKEATEATRVVYETLIHKNKAVANATC